MGATISYLSYRAQKQPLKVSHEHVSRQLNQGCGSSFILDDGDAPSHSMADLRVRIAALEKDLQISRAENDNKGVIIQYLLQSIVNKICAEESTTQPKEQLSALSGLKTTIEHTNKEIEEIKDKLRKAEGAIIALSTPSFPSPKLQSIQSFNNRSHSTRKSEIVAVDLIDLMDCNQDFGIVKTGEEDTILPDDFYEDELETEEVLKDANRDQLLHQSSDSAFEDSSYIVHFTHSDEDAKSEDAAKIPATKVEMPRNSPDTAVLLGQQISSNMISEKNVCSATDNRSSPSSTTLASTSFSSTTGDTSPPGDVHANLIDEAFLQLKALDSEGGDLDKSMAIVSSLAGRLSGLGTSNEAEPFQSTAPAPTESEDLQISTENTIIKPRWSLERIFDSSQDRQAAVLINRRSAHAGLRDVPCPGFFKYGIRFVPGPTEQDFYRTVVISGLPPFVTMEGLLKKVRGGMLVDAKLLDTVDIMGSNTGLVTFLRERSAIAYEVRAERNPIIFGSVAAQVALVPTPTWPTPVDLRTSMEEYGRTRCVKIRQLPPHTSLPTLRKMLTASPVLKSTSVEYMDLGADGVLELRFSSVRAAEYSSALFKKTLGYRGCIIQYVPDPCAQPLETLLERSRE